MRQIDYFVWTPHYLDHALPVWKEIPPGDRGLIVISDHKFPRSEFLGKAENLDVRWVSGFQSAADFFQDRNTLVGILTVNVPLVGLIRRPLFFQDHGLGQFYDVPYRHVPDLPQLVGTLAPNESFRRWAQERFPEADHRIVGSPSFQEKRERLNDTKRSDTEKPLVTFSFHFDRELCPETRSSFPVFREALLELKQHEEFDLAGHAHPRIREEIREWCQQHNIRFIREFSDVAQEADLYIMDNSSTLFEFAALGKPVVVLNAPFYRRDVDHGLRFWEAADVGIQCDDPDELETAVLQALEDPDSIRERREVALDKVLPHREGDPIGMSVEALTEFTKQLDPDRDWDQYLPTYPGFRSLIRTWLKEHHCESVAIVGAGGLCQGMLTHSPELLDACAGIIHPFADPAPTNTIKGINVIETEALDSVQADGFILAITEYDETFDNKIKQLDRPVGRLHRDFCPFSPYILQEIYYSE